MMSDPGHLDVLPIVRDRLSTALTIDERTVVVASGRDLGLVGLEPDSDAVAGTIAPTTLERLALERMASAIGPRAERMVGIGGGRAMDVAKRLAYLGDLPLELAPTSTGSSAVWSEHVAARHRRSITYLPGAFPDRVVLDRTVIDAAPLSVNNAGAGELIAALTALDDWHLAARRGRRGPDRDVEVDLLRVGHALDGGGLGPDRPDGDGSDRDDRAVLIEQAALLARARNRTGDPRCLDRTAHAVMAAYEHRIGAPASCGGMLGLGAVVAVGLAERDLDSVVSRLQRWRVPAHPLDLDLDEPTFYGVLRHTVRYALGEDLPYSVLYEADLNTSAAERIWAALWQIPRA